MVPVLALLCLATAGVQTGDGHNWQHLGVGLELLHDVVDVRCDDLRVIPRQEVSHDLQHKARKGYVMLLSGSGTQRKSCSVTVCVVLVLLS